MCANTRLQTLCYEHSLDSAIGLFCANAKSILKKNLLNHRFELNSGNLGCLSSLCPNHIYDEAYRNCAHPASRLSQMASRGWLMCRNTDFMTSV